MLELKGISKGFPGVQALDEVSIKFDKNSIHAVLGENGAGKSTLMNVICGVLQPDKGEIFLDGRKIKVNDHIDALDKKISIVNQELQILSQSTVAENIMLDKMIIYGKTGFINWKEVNNTAKKYLKMIGLDIPPTTIIGGLSAAKKQMIEIAKALASETKLLLLDEPTSAISEIEARKLFDILRVLKEKGKILIFVTHKLDEVFEVCDKISVLRDGKLVGTHNIKEVDKEKVVKMMIGREREITVYKNKNINRNKVILEVKNLYKDKKAKNVNFHLFEGEILGFYGLVGSGRTEVARMVIGEDRKESGEIFVKGKKANINSINESLYRYKIGYVTENRKEEGLFLKNDVKTNICVTIWQIIKSKILGFINSKKEIYNTKEMIRELDIKVNNCSQMVNTLSGGNQQKVSISKWMIANCDTYIFDEPTIGIDIGAKDYIHNLIYSIANKNKKSIILISSDMPEIIKLADRILIFDENKIIGELDLTSGNKKDYKEVSEEIGRIYLEVKYNGKGDIKNVASKN